MRDKHFKCWLWKILWSLGGLSLVLGWASLPEGMVAGLDSAVWFWNGLVLGVLSITIKLDCQDCGICKA